jgi:hypothetical protein
MKSWFTVTIQSANMQNLASNTEVFNLAEIPDIICVKLPDSMPRDMELSGIYDLNANKSLDFYEYVTRDEHKPWIDIRSSLLDLSVGQHVYKLTFTKLGIDLPAICWFGYIVQDNHVDKPYIYMDRSEDTQS